VGDRVAVQIRQIPHALAALCGLCSGGSGVFATQTRLTPRPRLDYFVGNSKGGDGCWFVILPMSAHLAPVAAVRWPRLSETMEPPAGGTLRDLAATTAGHIDTVDRTAEDLAAFL